MNKSDFPLTFHWALGFENTFIPQSRPGLRALEEYQLTQHYSLWRGDLDRVAALGITRLRWGIPWYLVQPAPDRWDWAWVDQVLDYMVNTTKIQPILDLMHYGTPLWLENSFINSGYPEQVAEYAYAVAERFGGLIQCYTPLNEPTVNAEFSGRRGCWPPYLEGNDGYVKVLVQIARGIVLTVQAVRQAQSNPVFVQVEALGWSWAESPVHWPLVENDRNHELLAFDLVTGRVGASHPLREYLQAHGVSQRDLDWFHARAVSFDVLGVNFYPWSGGAWVTGANNLPRRDGELMGGHLADAIRYNWRRYQLPLMVTETSARRDVSGRGVWMDETVGAVRAVQAEGIPVVGYTWFPAMTMIDWEYRNDCKSLTDHLIHLGLWDCELDHAGVLVRNPTPLVDRFQKYIQGRL